MELEFGPAGVLLSSIYTGDSWEVTPLTYRVEGDTLVLVADNVPEPRPWPMPFHLDADGTLVIELQSGSRFWYRRGERRTAT